MRRLIALALVLAACGAPATTEGTTVTDPGEPLSTSSVDQGAPGSTSPVGSDDASPTTVASDRQPAPDFSLDLANGGSYTLSQGAKPVYLVFWAEW